MRARLILVVAVIFAAVLTFPYLSLDVSDSRLDVSAGLHYSVLVEHIFTATVTLVLGLITRPSRGWSAAGWPTARPAGGTSPRTVPG